MKKIVTLILFQFFINMKLIEKTENYGYLHVKVDLIVKKKWEYNVLTVYG